jgi:hypothetical protein
MRTPTPAVHRPARGRRGVLAAVALTLIWHGALVGWLSTLGLPAHEPGGTSDPTHRVDIVFLPRRDDAPPPAVAASPEPARRRAHSAQSTTVTAIAMRALEDAPHGPPPATASATGMETLAGDDQWTPPSPPSPAQGRDVLQPRNPLARDALDAPPRLRVRMRPPPSVEMWLKKLAPAGYEADPCPEVARAIAGLAPDAAASSRALLDDVLHYQAKYCS